MYQKIDVRSVLVADAKTTRLDLTDIFIDPEFHQFESPAQPSEKKK